MFSSFRLWKKPNNNIKNLSTNIPDNSCMYCSYIYWRHLSSLKSWKHIHPTVGTQLATDGNSQSEYGTTSAQYQRTQSGMQRIRKMTITLGLLIMVMLLSVMPRIILGLVIIAHPFNMRVHTAFSISDLYLFINPLFDPIIYALRMRSFSQHLKCR